MIQYRGLPTYTQAIISGNNIIQAWYRWFHDTDVGTPPSAEAAILVGVSPFTYQADKKGFVIINGGTVSQVQFMRVGTYITGQTAGIFPLSLADQLIVTYSGKPTMTFVPQ